MPNSFRLDTIQKRVLIIASVLVPIGFGLLSLYLGRDSGADLKVYHWYNGYAYLTNRYDIDMQPSQDAFLLNPYLDAVFYEVGSSVTPRAFAFLLGLVQGLNFPLLLLLSLIALKHENGWKLVATSLAVALAGICNAVTIGIVGTAFPDSFLFSLPLTGILIVAYMARRRGRFDHRVRSAFALAVAGAWVGAAFGLKLTNGYWTVGIALAVPLCFPGMRRAVQGFVAFSLGVAAGMLASSGVWWWHVWRLTGNPIFPYYFPLYHNLFQSPLAPGYDPEYSAYEDIRSLLTFPFKMVINYRRGSGVPVLDLRLCAVLVLLIVAGCIQLYRLAMRNRKSPSTQPDRVARFSIAVFAFSYMVWMVIYGALRYAVGLLVLAPLIIVLLVNLLPFRNWIRDAMALVLFGIVLFVMRPQDYGRAPFDDRPLHVVVPKSLQLDGAMILMTGSEDPSAFGVPSFPPNIPFIRISSTWLDPSHPEWGYNKLIAKRIKEHHGPKYVIFYPQQLFRPQMMIQSLGYYDLVADLEKCIEIQSNLGDVMRVCPLTSKPNIESGKRISLRSPLVSVSFAEGGNSRQYTGEGWGEQETGGRWTVGGRAIVQSGPYLAGLKGMELDLILQSRAFVGPRATQRVRVLANGTDLGEVAIGAKLESRTLKIPGSVTWNRDDVNLEFKFPDARSPKSVGASADDRLLGLWVQKIEIRKSAAPTAPGNGGPHR